MAMTKVLRKGEFLGKDRFPIAVFRWAEHTSEELHGHQFVELVVITRGLGHHMIAEEAWPVGAGDVFVISGNQQHGYQDVEGLSLINILYDQERLAMPTQDLGTLPGYHALFKLEPAYRKRHRFESRLRLSTDQLIGVESLVDALQDELRRMEPGYGFMATSLFMQLVGYLARCYGRWQEPATEALLRVGEAIGYLETHYRDNVSLDTLARIARMSKRNFQRVFREGVGRSPIEALIRLRVTRAAELLRQGHLTITEVAFEAGFEDSNYFARQFRKSMGVSPRAYRKSTNALH